MRIRFEVSVEMPTTPQGMSIKQMVNYIKTAVDKWHSQDDPSPSQDFDMDGIKVKVQHLGPDVSIGSPSPTETKIAQ